MLLVNKIITQLLNFIFFTTNKHKNKIQGTLLKIKIRFLNFFLFLAFKTNLSIKKLKKKIGVPLVGLEPTISGLGDRCLIH